MKPFNLVAIRESDEDAISCCGCGKVRKIQYRVMGKYDHEHEEFKESIYLCFACFKPLSNRVETIKK